MEGTDDSSELWRHPLVCYERQPLLRCNFLAQLVFPSFDLLLSVVYCFIISLLGIKPVEAPMISTFEVATALS